MTIAFTGGGTGGHIYPGLAVADELKKLLPDTRLIWIGSSSKLERDIVEKAQIEFFSVPSGKLRRYFSLKNFTDLFKVMAGFFVARKILKRQKVRALFSKGGFVSVPPCAAASSLKIPVFTHESDYSPGLATRLNARYVRRTGGKIFTSYEETSSFLPPPVRKFITVSGNPVRAAFRNADAARGRSFLGLGSADKILLILGGSQGAAEINALVRSCLEELTRICVVVHQIGPNQKWDIPESQNYKPYHYIKEELPDIMAAADIVAGRSGAGIWEWAVCGKPMILIPLTGSGTRGDQAENAGFFEKKKAAIVLSGEKAKQQFFPEKVAMLFNDASLRQAMAESSQKIGRIDGALIIARIIAKEANDSGGKK